MVLTRPFFAYSAETAQPINAPAFSTYWAFSRLAGPQYTHPTRGDMSVADAVLKLSYLFKAALVQIPTGAR